MEEKQELVSRQVGARHYSPSLKDRRSGAHVLNCDNGLGTTGLWDILKGYSWELDCCRVLEENKRHLVTCWVFKDVNI